MEKIIDLKFILIPILGYVALWVFAGLLFLIYFKIYKVQINLKKTVSMIQELPAWLAIVTVPICSFFAFFLVTKAVLYMRPEHTDLIPMWEIGTASLILTIVLDILITVIGEKINILKFPINVMYLLAYLVIIPAVLVAG